MNKELSFFVWPPIEESDGVSLGRNSGLKSGGHLGAAITILRSWTRDLTLAPGTGVSYPEYSSFGRSSRGHL